MKPIGEAEPALTGIDRIRRQGGAWKSNFFLSERQLQEAADSGRLFLEQHARWVVLVEQNGLFSRLYLTAADDAAARDALSQTDFSGPGPLIADLVGPEADIQPLRETFRESGFRDYALYRRMARISLPDSPPDLPRAVPVEPAAAGDGPAIRDILWANFDPYCDHLPGPDEIEKAVADRSILVCRNGPVLTGLYHYETTGLTSTGRFLWTDAGCRGQGLGSHLVRRYFEENRQVRRFLLWVNTANLAAMATHRRWGYAPDPLCDFIMMRGGRSDG